MRCAKSQVEAPDSGTGSPARVIPKAIQDWGLLRAILRIEFNEIVSMTMASSIMTTMLPTGFPNLVLEH